MAGGGCVGLSAAGGRQAGLVVVWRQLPPTRCPTTATRLSTPTRSPTIHLTPWPHSPHPCRRKYKEETARLNQQLKSASMGSKGTEKQADRLQKEIDKLRGKLVESEAKLRTAVQDKTNSQLEKAGVERELKALRAQAEKLTKNMDKVGGREVWRGPGGRGPGGC